MGRTSIPGCERVLLGALVIGLVAAWALDPLNAAFGGRFNSTWYDISGIVPVACVLFALSWVWRPVR